MKKQYPVIEQSDGHSCGIFVLMAADAILSEKSPGITRNCHVEKYRLYVLQRILQYAKDKGDMQGGGNHMMAVDGQGNVRNEIQTVTLETRDVLENSCTISTEQGGPTIHEEDGHETHEGTDSAVASDENTENYPCLDQHLLDKQKMACLLVVALAENNLEERMLWARSDTGTRVERETYKKYIVWALKVFDINEKEYTENMMKPILSQLAKCCLHHEAGSYRIRNHEVAIKLREILLRDVGQLVERMDIEFIFRYVTFRGDRTEAEQLDVPLKIELKHDDLHIVAKRFLAAVHGRKFAFVCMHSLFQVETFVDMVWENILHNLNKDRSELLKVLSKKDIIYGYSFLFWASITDNSNLLKKALNSVQFMVKNRQEALFGSCFGNSLANFDYLCSKNNWQLDTLCMTLPELPRPLIIKLQLAVAVDLGVKFGKCSLLDIACMGGLSAVASRLSHLIKMSKNRNRSRKNTYVHYASLCLKGKDTMDTITKIGKLNVNIKGPEGSTPLHYACAVGNVSIVSYLLQEVVDISEQNKKGETGLHLACIYGNAEVVTKLLQNKGIIHLKDNAGRTPLHRAAWQGDRVVVEVLLQNKANVDEKRQNGSTPLHDASGQGHRVVVEVLLKNKANVDEKDKEGSTPLNDLQNKANVDEKDKEGRTPLHHAAYQGHRMVVEVLLQNKANVDEKRQDGSTPLHHAAYQGHREVVDVLLQNKANVDEKRNDGSTPLHHAAYDGHREVVEELLQNKANVDEKDKEGRTPLHHAAYQGHRVVVEVLLQNKANVHEKRNDGSTPLHHAAYDGHREVVDVLLQNKANVDEKDKEGRSPLHHAAWQGHRMVVEVLLQNKANVDEKRQEGSTPLHHAAYQGHREVVEVLLQNKANVDEKDKEGRTPLHHAASQGHREVVEVLLQNKANVDEKDKEGRTPLHHAARQGHREVVEVLLQNKAN
ncbi:serine/threonine-protein phosphatase 6 regulatory ankyrin repeat subunit B-like, partial [Haliotis rufescens]|uniref:serine/threonine-protein phosphatase 6 regulatory ankyrin repeat subunit B-like n=1 Tax=Haliotis rufescens TaxID=6454 RepID=UPI00201F3B2F